jgi:phospholipid/cholesterol/gamma-HCH transport system permease protein
MAQLEFTAPEAGTPVLALAGRLDAASLGPIWAQARETISRNPDRPIVVDCSRVDYCDGTGIALLVELLRSERAPEAGVRVEGLQEGFQRLLDQYDPAEFREPPPRQAAPGSLIERLGHAGRDWWQSLYDLIAFVGEAMTAIVAALRRPGSVRWIDALSVAEEAGVNALPIVALIGFLMGVILAFQSAIAMRQFGAEIFVADLVGLAMARELGPLMTAILLAGRSGAAFAAEIGTMKVNDEVNALSTMGLDPVRFLVVPRVLAAVAMTPLLSVFAVLIGLVGGAMVMQLFDIPFYTYYQEIVNRVKLNDLFGGLFKSVVFGVLVAGIGCLRGLQTRTGAAAVGLSATSAVVTGIVLIVAVDGVFAVIFYYLDI